MQSLGMRRLMKLGMVGALIVGVMAVGLWGNRSNRALAQDNSQTFMVYAGAFGAANVEVYGFAPSTIKVHRGDTIMWHIASFHNIHIGNEPASLITVTEVDGTPIPALNPAVGFPSVQNGAAYTGGDVNSGLPEGEVLTGTFSLVMDVEPGTYLYFCDIHPGMTGIIEVVADDVEIPNPAEAAAQGQAEMDEQINAAVGKSFELAGTAATEAVDGVFNVTVGGSAGRASINLFNSALAMIHAGESVTWTVAADSVEGHFVNSTPYDPAAVPDIVPIMVEGQPPILSIGPGFLGTTPDGSEVKAGDSFNSPALAPGQSYTLTFTEPGVYAYNCHIHPGMTGVVIVQPTM